MNTQRNQLYADRTDEIRTYFDRTAIDAWKRFATDAPMSRIRSIVRDGRAEMHKTILSHFPEDLTGWRILDAGCGGGNLVFDLAARGATVHGMDLSAQIIDLANDRARNSGFAERVSFEAGDALTADRGAFDAVVSMDCLIHYGKDDVVQIVSGLTQRMSRSNGTKIVFSFAPATPLLLLKHRVGGLFPKSDQAPAIQPVAQTRLVRALGAHKALEGWTAEPGHRVKKPFYISQVMEVRRNG